MIHLCLADAGFMKGVSSMLTSQIKFFWKRSIGRIGMMLTLILLSQIVGTIRVWAFGNQSELLDYISAPLAGAMLALGGLTLALTLLIAYGRNQVIPYLKDSVTTFLVVAAVVFVGMGERSTHSISFGSQLSLLLTPGMAGVLMLIAMHLSHRKVPVKV